MSAFSWGYIEHNCDIKRAIGLVFNMASCAVLIFKRIRVYSTSKIVKKLVMNSLTIHHCLHQWLFVYTRVKEIEFDKTHILILFSYCIHYLCCLPFFSCPPSVSPHQSVQLSVFHTKSYPTVLWRSETLHGRPLSGLDREQVLDKRWSAKGRRG